MFPWYSTGGSNQDHPQENEMQKAKWLSEEALAVKRSERKSKGEKERYIHLNAEFQRIARRDKKAFLSNQCKEIEENNRMGKTKDLFKEKNTLHASKKSLKTSLKGLSQSIENCLSGQVQIFLKKKEKNPTIQ